MPSGKIPTLIMKPNSCTSIAHEKCSSKSRKTNHGKLRNYELTLTCLNCEYPVQAKPLVKKVFVLILLIITKLQHKENKQKKVQKKYSSTTYKRQEQ